MADLLIRAAMNDHLVLGDLLAPTIRPLPLGRRPLIGQLVADAHVAAARPGLAGIARGAGIPYLVDPDTTLLQTAVDPGDKWTQLPYAVAEPVLAAAVDVAELAAQVVEFQLEQGATVVIPPYFYATSPTDIWFHRSMELIEVTVDYMRSHDIRLPLMPVFCGQLQSFAAEDRWDVGIDRYLTVARDASAKSMALCMSPAGAGSDGYGKVSRLFATALHAKESRLEVIAWRQGVYGPGLVAAGLDGYECGIATGEQTQVTRRQSSRKPKTNPDQAGGGGGGIYLETLGHSVPRKAGQILLGDLRTRAKVMCDDESCCVSASATLDQSKYHAVRARARQFNQLIEQPHKSWRLNYIARQADAAVTLAAQANAVLKQEGLTMEIKARNMEALARVTSELVTVRTRPRSA